MARQIGNVAAGAAATRRRRPTGFDRLLAPEHPHVAAARRVLAENPTPSIASAASSHVTAVAAGKGTPGVKKLPQSVYDAINRAVTPAFGRWAKANYGVGGKRLLALVAAGEGGGSIDEGTSNTSSAGARGPFQFISSTRDAYRQRYHIDPWHSDLAAARAAMIHLRGTGVAGYNPGMPSYTHYILSQSVDSRPLVTGGYGSAGGRGGGGGGGMSPATPGSVSREQVQPGGTGIVELVRALTEQKPVPPSTPLQAPSFSAGPTMPEGFQVPESGPPAPPPPDLTDLMSLVQPGSPVPRSEYTPGTGPDIGGSGGGGGGRIGGLPNYGPSGGRNVNVSGSPLDRPGQRTHPYVVHAVDLIGDILGSSIELGTGTQHNQFTTNGNISAHWSGGAVDLPSTGKRLMAIGRSALIAAGMDPHEARKAGPGLYNLNGWQIIFGTNSQALGGDHTDHVHVQPPAGWKRPRRWR